MSPQSRRRLTPFPRQFMFATGIENSYPTISLSDGKTLRVDEMEKCGHYKHWQEDLGAAHSRNRLRRSLKESSHFRKRNVKCSFATTRNAVLRIRTFRTD